MPSAKSTSSAAHTSQPWPPTIGLCGHSKSGKTTLATHLAQHFAGAGLDVGYVKHAHRPMTLDAAGKDTDELFQAGASTVGLDPQQSFVRRRREAKAAGVSAARGANDDARTWLGRQLDLVIVEGDKASARPKLWLLGEGEAAPPEGVANVIAALPRGDGRFAQATEVVDEWLAKEHRGWPMAVGVLASEPALVTPERAIEVGRGVSDLVLLVGNGWPGDIAPDVPRLPPAVDADGATAGLLAAFRWAPDRRWLFLSCDADPTCAREVRELLSCTKAKRWVTGLDMPNVPLPLAVVCDPPVGELLEDLIRAGGELPTNSERQRTGE